MMALAPTIARARRLARAVSLLLVVAIAVALLPAVVCAAGSESSRRIDDLQLAVDTPGLRASGRILPDRIRMTNLKAGASPRFRLHGHGGRRLESSDRLPPGRDRSKRNAAVFAAHTACGHGQLWTIAHLRKRAGNRGSVAAHRFARRATGLDRSARAAGHRAHAGRSRLHGVESAVESLTLASGGMARPSYMGYGGGHPFGSNDFQVIRAADAPESWLDYSALDIVAISLPLFDKATAEARSALLKWAATGGTLLIYDVGQPAGKSADLARLLDLSSRPRSFKPGRRPIRPCSARSKIEEIGCRWRLEVPSASPLQLFQFAEFSHPRPVDGSARKRIARKRVEPARPAGRSRKESAVTRQRGLLASEPHSRVLLRRDATERAGLRPGSPSRIGMPNPPLIR